MITTDPYGVSHAVRVWDAAPVNIRREYVHTCDPQKWIDICLNCDLPESACRGCMRPDRRPHAKKSDPCQTCRSRSICESYHGTCHEKEIWKHDYKTNEKNERAKHRRKV